MLGRSLKKNQTITDGRTIPEGGTLPIGTGKRLSASVLFLDICSFSQRASESELEQENLLRALSLFFSEMIRIVEEHGGTVEKNTGDGLMAYFVKTPNSDKLPQIVAVEAALTMFYAGWHMINPVLISSSIEPFAFRICIDHGNISVAEVGAARGFRGIVAIGTTANIACKMLSVASANTILIGDLVRAGLPEDWRSQFTRIKKLETGWHYRSDGRAYPFYEYIGRWEHPQ